MGNIQYLKCLVGYIGESLCARSSPGLGCRLIRPLCRLPRPLGLHCLHLGDRLVGFGSRLLLLLGGVALPLGRLLIRLGGLLVGSLHRCRSSRFFFGGRQAGLPCRLFFLCHFRSKGEQLLGAVDDDKGQLGDEVLALSALEVVFVARSGRLVLQDAGPGQWGSIL